MISLIMFHKVISDHADLCMSSKPLTCSFSRFRTTNDGKFDRQGRVGLGLTEEFNRVDHEGVACLLGGKEVYEVLEEDRKASIKRVLHMLDQISLCILYIHKEKKKWESLFTYIVYFVFAYILYLSSTCINVFYKSYIWLLIYEHFWSIYI